MVILLHCLLLAEALVQGAHRQPDAPAAAATFVSGLQRRSTPPTASEGGRDRERVTIEIDRPMRQVYDGLIDFQAYPQWAKAVKSAEFTSGRPGDEECTVVFKAGALGFMVQVSLPTWRCYTRWYLMDPWAVRLIGGKRDAQRAWRGL